MGKDSPTSLSIAIHSQQQTTPEKDSSGSPIAGLLGKSRYKFWVLAAILLLAFWSMFTGSVSLKWSSGNLDTLSHDPDFSLREDLDVLELEEREKVVRKMWDVYTQSPRVRLPRFWVEAFEAAYENLSSDVAGVRDYAVSEIAKLSTRSLNLDPPSSQSKSSSSQGRKKASKQADKKKEMDAHNVNLHS
ncbi:hypothetical protein HRI_005209000 [Hibiscus trionum]|uniref:Uncharacterized protein n=1 Tax=Hibiscus trionum TaxID=183268 RepID=A0A9W7MRP1_HIBTR|nr:hypothetical protein HRI_005209000 [Hibiscus trionum]